MGAPAKHEIQAEMHDGQEGPLGSETGSWGPLWPWDGHVVAGKHGDPSPPPTPRLLDCPPAGLAPSCCLQASPWAPLGSRPTLPVPPPCQDAGGTSGAVPLCACPADNYSEEEYESFSSEQEASDDAVQGQVTWAWGQLCGPQGFRGGAGCGAPDALRPPPAKTPSNCVASSGSQGPSQAPTTQAAWGGEAGSLAPEHCFLSPICTLWVSTHPGGTRR